MSNAHINHKHGVVKIPTLRPKSSNSKKRNKHLARVRKSALLEKVWAHKEEQRKKLGV